jgi:ribosomal protein S18 acetylase RimI-like enzyme
MNIREAKKWDVESMLKIFTEEYRKPPYNEDWKEDYALSKLAYYFRENKIDVAEDESMKMLGFIVTSNYYWCDGLRGSVDELVVDSRFQGKGIGRRLMEKAEERFRMDGIKKVSLMVHKESEAFEIYKKWRFEDEGFIFMIKDLK